MVIMTNQASHYVYKREFFLKIQSHPGHVIYGQKIIDWPPPEWQTRISPRIFLKIQHVYGQKMIDPPEWQTRISLRIFFKDSTCVWSKDDWPPSMTDQDLHLEFF